MRLHFSAAIFGALIVDPSYRHWLERQKYDSGTITAQMHRADRVEKHYGDLDDHHRKDELRDVIEALRYTAEDKRRGRPNPSKIPFAGDTYSNLASYRNAVERYRKFKDEVVADPEGLTGHPSQVVAVSKDDDISSQRIGLERDLQATLRLAIHRLEEGLVIVDDGAERSVESGFIDITARDASGAIVAIELKAGTAGQRAVAQLLSYMGDLALEDHSQLVRGILVAADFDKRAKAAARVVPNVILRRYAIQFHFSEGGDAGS